MGRPLSGARALWADTAPAAASRGALTGDVEVDVAVVGAGFTGLWTAHYLAEADPSLRIVVLEAETVGFGASGRNGGWCSALFPASLDSLAALGGRRGSRGPGRRDARLGRRGRPRLRCARHRRPARQERHHRPGPLPRPGRAAPGPRSSTPAAGASARTTSGCSTSRRHGRWSTRPARPVRRTPPTARPSTRCGSRAAWPTRWSSAGSRSTSTPAPPRSTPAACSTAGGTVAAGTVLRATEGWTSTLPGHRRDVVPVYSLVIATAPLPAAGVGPDRAGPSRDVQRPPAPHHLRPAHRRRPTGVRRPRGAVPPRIADPTVVRRGGAGVRRPASDPRRPLPGASRHPDHARVGRPARRRPRLVRVGRPRSGDRASAGPAGTSATG